LVSRLWSQPLSQSQRFVPGLGLKILASTLVEIFGLIYRRWFYVCVLSCSAHSTFRVSSATDSGRSHSLQANDELDKRHWLQCIDDALCREVLPLASAKVRRHSSDVSSTDTLSADFQSPGTSHEDCSASSAATYEENVESCSFNAAEKLPPVARSLQVTNCILEEL